MRLKIVHRTEYRYGAAVTLQPHQLIVTPRDSDTLRVLQRSIHCVPDAEIAWTVDVFGNLIATATFSQPTAHLIITNALTVDQTAPEWPIFAVDPAAHSYPFAYSLDDVIDLGALAQPDWLQAGGETVAAWARGFVMSPQTDTLALLKDLNSGMLDAIVYRQREEEGTQSPAETLKIRSGSCRDIAGLFIEAARHLGFGARAVSGYLWDPDQKADDASSTHAWAEIYLPGAGWVPFDPSNRSVGGARLVPVAIARLNRQIMPLSGGYLGSADDFEAMNVDVQVRVVD